MSGIDSAAFARAARRQVLRRCRLWIGLVALLSGIFSLMYYVLFVHSWRSDDLPLQVFGTSVLIAVIGAAVLCQLPADWEPVRPLSASGLAASALASVLALDLIWGVVSSSWALWELQLCFLAIVASLALAVAHRVMAVAWA